MADLYIMCGVPGVGKSTFLKNKNINTKPNTVIVSRDTIRFSIVKSDEEYFSHENEVLTIFWKQINDNLKIGKDVFADQTSLTPGARKKLLKHVKGYNHVYCIWIEADLNICLENNEKRKGTRSYVPRGTIRRMYIQFIKPSLIEGFDDIYHFINKNNKLIPIEEGSYIAQ